MKRTRLLRMLCAFAFILLVFLGLILHTGSGTLSAIGWRDIAAVCPLGALEAMLAEKTLIPRAILGALAVVAFCLILGRVFCGWICPVPFIKQLFGQEEHACESPSEKKAVNHTALQHRCVIPLRVIKASSGRTASSPSPPQRTIYGSCWCTRFFRRIRLPRYLPDLSGRAHLCPRNCSLAPR